MSTDTKAWLVEEYDINGKLVWKMISFFEPTELSWLNDLKSKKHNLKITELVAGKTKTIEGVKKYDSSRYVVGL